MNLDKLKALIRLANNNPNDNEANLAARRACKILAQDDFSLLNGHKTSNIAGAAAKTWEDIFRSKEPFWRTSNADFYRQYSRVDWSKAPHKDAPAEDDWTRETKKRPEPEWMPPEYKRNPTDDYDPVTGRKRQRKQEMRTCTKCGFEVMTFRYDEVPWVCNPCHWKEAGL